MRSDIEIANSAKMEKISHIAHKIGIGEDEIELYGSNKAKLSTGLLKRIENNSDGNLILVSAMTPTPLGEGKSTTTVGLVDALWKLGKKTIGTLREPSLGPVFGLKGGAAGGGFAQVNPMVDLNLHFTGDLHAITCANNLISACIDNHIYQGNELGIDPKRIVWQRCMDLNDRALRNVIVGLGAPTDGVVRPERFNITVASEIMAILCLARDIDDLRSRVDRLIIGYTYDRKQVTVKDLGITGSVLVVLKDAMKPNLVQTLENNPVLVHGGPFANIAHGCNSIIATKAALKLADYVVTEAGFGADLGAEKFLDIKCRVAGVKPSAVVIVATIKALKYHGKVKVQDVQKENVEAMMQGLANLEKHIDTIKQFNLPYVISLNRFSSDTPWEINQLLEWANNNNHPLAISEVWAKGGEGGIDLAKKVLEACDKNQTYEPLYTLDESVKEKIQKIAYTCYGANKVVFTDEAEKVIKQVKNTDYQNFYICMAKTPLSLTDNPKLVGAPKGFTVTIREIRISAGAQFLVCLTGDVMTMPGLPKKPNAIKIDIDNNYEIYNLS
ncbi:MAG TPA: formate--tetrahydrofolate ligase [Acholeplasmataceae bacterium]|jgi:formate--tetrahydrofolate ligase|nr:formate--tetrahydrofolate ligase [Acholeplasmataceae bacterium]